MNNTPKKLLTFSYDDGVTQDIRLIELFNKYGMKATFNVMLGSSDGEVFLSTEADKEKIKARYAGHEIAIHNEKHLNMLAKNTNGEYVYSNAECIAGGCKSHPPA
jgi:peptidoglycan/xylan/chitin deacetylase (PgdA/CDA1 family)